MVEKVIITTGKRKNAVARAKVESGSGKIYINGKPLEIWGNEVLRLWVKEPLLLAGNLSNKLDFYVTVKSGGISGQAEAVRMAIARALVQMSKGDELRQKFIEYDRNLLVYDPRRNEPHHGSGRGASRRGSRRHKQRSKR